jgi:Stigma-specific protein, Stig1
MWKVVVLVFGLAACGTVKEDGQLVDAPIVEPDAPACSVAEMCDGVCTDLTTDERHCGGCTTSCTNQQGCLAGSCVDATASCTVIRALDPNAISGSYTHEANGTQFFCDMTNNLQYDELGYGQFNVAHAGFEIITGAMLTDPVAQQAFVFLFNHQAGGGILLDPGFTATNCCLTTGAGVRLVLGGSLLFTAVVGATDFSCGVSHTDPKYTFKRVNGGAVANAPMPADYFTQFPPVDDNAQCADGNNPALFFKRSPL